MSSIGTSNTLCQTGEDIEAGKQRSILLQTTRRMFLFCCWPLHKCVTVLSLLDTTITVIGAYKSLNVVLDSYPEMPWIAVFQLAFFTSFSICQVLATVLLILGHKRQIANYLWPRLVLLVGLLLCSIAMITIMFFYFNGEADNMNKFFFSLYEWFFGEELTEQDRKDLKLEMKMYAGAFMALTIIFGIYTVFELWITKKYYDSMKSFHPVATEPSAPQQMAYNPEYNSQKMYPNLA